MKRHFLTGLKALAVSALAFAAVSCYDDSELWGELEGLEQRVAALEEKLNSEVKAINTTLGALKSADEKLTADIAAVVADVKKANEIISKLDAADGTINGRIDDLEKALSTFKSDAEKKIAEVLAQVAVVKVEKNAAGNYILTFADGNTLEVSAPDSNSNNTGVVTTVEVEGVTYWAVIGADGKTTVLDAIVHPDTKLEFKVDPKTYEVFVTYNGKDWEATGVVVKDAETINIVTGFEDTKDYVVLTVGGVEYKLPKVSTNTFDIVSGKVFFNRPSMTQAIPVAMEGVVSSMVAKSPAGWTIKLTDAGLMVTSPKGFYDDLYDEIVLANENDERSGIIEVWVVLEDGRTLIGRLSVALGSQSDYATFTITDKKNVRIEVAEGFEQGNFYYGACTLEDYDADKIFNFVTNSEYEDLPKGIYRYFNYDVEPIETTLSELVGSEIETGKTYVVWGVCLEMAFNYETYTREMITSAEDIMTTFVTPLDVEFSATPTWNNARLNISVSGSNGFFASFAAYEDYQMMSNMLSPESLAMMDMSLIEALPRAFNTGYKYAEDYDGEATLLGLEEDYGYELKPSTKYVALIIPLEPYKDEKSYTLSDVVVKEFETTSLTYGGKGTVIFENKQVNGTSFIVEVSSTAESVTITNIMPTADYLELKESFELGMTIQDYMMDNFSKMKMYSEKSFSINHGDEYSPLTPGTSYTVLGMAIDKDGKSSEVTEHVIETKSVVYNEDLTVAISNIDMSDPNKTAVTVKVNGANQTTKVCVWSAASKDKNLENMVLDYGFAANYYGYNWLTLDANGMATANVKSTTPWVYVVAYDIDESTKSVTSMSRQLVENVDKSVKDAASLKVAIEAGGDVFVGANITLTEKLTITSDMDVTLNLRGKTVTFDNSGTAGYAILNYGKLTVSNGTILAKGTAIAAGLYNEGEATLNCNITSENSNAIKVDKGGKLTINGGKYVSKNATGQALRVGNWQSGQASAWELNINGGEFIGPWAGLYIVNNYAGLATAGKADIKNATFQGSVDVVDSGVKGSDIVFDNVKNVTISSCTLKTESIHSETTGTSEINGKTINTIEDVYTTVFGAN